MIIMVINLFKSQSLLIGETVNQINYQLKSNQIKIFEKRETGD